MLYSGAMKINGKVGKKRTRAAAIRPCGMWLAAHPLSWSVLECLWKVPWYISWICKHRLRQVWTDPAAALEPEHNWTAPGEFQGYKALIKLWVLYLFHKGTKIVWGHFIWKLKLKQRWIFKLDNEPKHVSKTTKEVFKWRKRELAIVDFKLFLVMWFCVNSLNYETKMHFTCSGCYWIKKNY